MIALQGWDYRRNPSWAHTGSFWMEKEGELPALMAVLVERKKRVLLSFDYFSPLKALIEFSFV